MGCLDLLSTARSIDPQIGDRCKSVDFDTELFPEVIIPTAFVSQLAPHWGSCFPFISKKDRLSVAAYPMNDPPIVLTGTTGSMPEPILPTGHRPPFSTESDPYPGATPVAMASPTLADPIPGTTNPPSIVPSIDSDDIVFSVNGVTITAQNIPDDRSYAPPAENVPALEFQDPPKGKPGQIVDPGLFESSSAIRGSETVVGFGIPVYGKPGQILEPQSSVAFNTIIISGTSVSIGGPALTISDHTFSLASSGLFIDGTLATSSKNSARPSSSRSGRSDSDAVFDSASNGSVNTSSTSSIITMQSLGVNSLTPSAKFVCMMWFALYIIT
jgi:hypothetical protein